MRGRPSNQSVRRGFTLVELLVAMSVLVLLVLLVTQLLNNATSVIGASGKHLDSDSEARLIFNRLATDLDRALRRADIDDTTFKQPAGMLGNQYAPADQTVVQNLQTGNDHLAFFSLGNGYFSGAAQPRGREKAPLSLVAYTLAKDPVNQRPGLRRLGKGLGWEPDAQGAWGSVVFLPRRITQQWPMVFPTNSTAALDQDYDTVGSQVVRFEYTYLLKQNLGDSSGASYPAKLSVTPYWSYANNKMASSAAVPHTSVNGFADVDAIVVAIAVLDSSSQLLVTDYTKLTSSLGDAVDAADDAKYHGDIAAAWNAALNTPNFAATAGIPQRAAAAVRVYERYVYLRAAQP